MDNLVIKNKIKNKSKTIGMLLAIVALGGCFESATQKQQQEQQQQQKNDSQAAVATKAVNSADLFRPELAQSDLAQPDFVQPTTVPTTNAERQVLLDALDIKTTSPVDKRRLALFVRYTYFADNKDRQLETLEQLVKEIAAMRETRPDDHELTALYGSAVSLQTVFFLDNLGKTNLLSKKGSRYLDRAVKNAPNHLGVRLYRGITYAEMPAFLGKARQAVEDFKLIKSASDERTNDKFAAMINYYYAMALIKDQQQDSGIKHLTALAGKNISPWSERASALKKEKG